MSFQSQHNLLIFIILMVTLLFPPLSMAQTTGRVGGIVVDKVTGEVLIGANVQVMGTMLGAATNQDGEFLILNVPVGSHIVKATYIGYVENFIENVVVNIGLTTKLSLELSSRALQTEPVTVMAEKSLIQRSATNATRIVTEEEIKNLPVRGLAMVANLQPGMVNQDGKLYIRGGRSDEVSFYIDGTPIRSVYSGNRIGDVIPEALEELQIQAGGYEAAYGGANSGIVAMVMKEGTHDYQFNLRLETDNFASNNRRFLGSYSYGYSDYSLTGSGPIPLTGNKCRFFLAGENRFIKDWYRRFWEPFILIHDQTVLADGSVLQLEDTGARGGMVGESVDKIEWGGGVIPSGASANQFTYNGVLTAEFHNLRFRFSGFGSYRKLQENNMPIMRLFNTERLPKVEGSDITLNGKMVHMLSPKTFYELSLSFHDERMKRYDPMMKEDYWAYFDSVRNAQAGFQFYGYTLPPLDYDFYGFRFERSGAVVAGYNHWKRNNIRAKLDLTRQMGHHTLQLGGEYQYWTLRAFSGFTSPGELAYLRANPDLIRDQERLERWLRSLGRNTYGYDLLGNETDKGLDPIDQARHPTIGAAYLQDRYEWQDLVLNFGIRLDGFWMDQWEPRDYTNPQYNTTENRLNFEEWQRSNSFYYLSPRFGCGFPATDKTMFHFQWGRFVQMPQMSLGYTSQSFLIYSLETDAFVSEPAAFVVRPEKTIQTEAGFSQIIGELASFDMTIFYKDIRDQLQIKRVMTSPEAVVGSYQLTQNGDFATIQGLEFRLTVRRTNRFQGWINYTYSDGRGTGSYLNQASASLDQGTNQITVITPLYFNQKHRGTINLDYRFQTGDAPTLLQRVGLNMVLNFNSGHPYTLSTGGVGQNDASQGAVLSDYDARGRQPLEPIGSSSTPWNFTLDARIDKSIQIGRFDFNFYFYVQNLLNVKNIINVFPRTGTDNDGFLNDPSLSEKIIEAQGGAGYQTLYQEINEKNRQHYLWDYTFRGEDLWSTPRQIRFGLKVEFR